VRARCAGGLALASSLAFPCATARGSKSFAARMRALRSSMVRTRRSASRMSRRSFSFCVSVGAGVSSLARRGAHGGRRARCIVPLQRKGQRWAENCPGAAKDVILAVKRSRIGVVRGATTSSCFRFGIPSGHSSGSHSTARAISFTRRFPAAIGGGRRIPSRPEACSALRSRAGEVCTATAQTRAKEGSFLFCSRCWRLLWHGPLRKSLLQPTWAFPGGWMLLPAWRSTAPFTPFSTGISGGRGLCVS